MDRAWRDAQASSNRDRGNTARKKREAAAETPEEREARLHHIIMRGRLATPGYSKCEAGQATAYESLIGWLLRRK